METLVDFKQSRSIPSALHSLRWTFMTLIEQTLPWTAGQGAGACIGLFGGSSGHA